MKLTTQNLDDALVIIVSAEMEIIRTTMIRMSEEEYATFRKLQRIWLYIYQLRTARQLEILKRQAWPDELEITGAPRFNEITGLDEDPSDGPSDDKE